ncbi:MAG: TIR domain-containing protein [SAR324 cluster bacterium]|nr:TIR domain-containing protein [SAR324 cluster bacterium]
MPANGTHDFLYTRLIGGRSSNPILIEEGQMPTNVFLSFAMEDKPLVEVFRSLAKNRTTNLNFKVYSVKEPFDRAWKTRVESIIRYCSVTICLVGSTTHRSGAVDWEIRKSIELGKKLLAVYLIESPVILPKALAEWGIEPYQRGSFVRNLGQIAS